MTDQPGVPDLEAEASVGLCGDSGNVFISGSGLTRFYQFTGKETMFLFGQPKSISM